MSSEKDKSTGKAYIFFFVMAVIFLLLVPYTGYVAYSQLVASASNYGVGLKDVMGSIIFSVVTTSGPYLAFSCIMYGFGVVLKKMSTKEE